MIILSYTLSELIQNIMSFSQYPRNRLNSRVSYYNCGAPKSRKEIGSCNATIKLFSNP